MPRQLFGHALSALREGASPAEVDAAAGAGHGAGPWAWASALGGNVLAAAVVDRAGWDEARRAVRDAAERHRARGWGEGDDNGPQGEPLPDSAGPEWGVCVPTLGPEGYDFSPP